VIAAVCPGATPSSPLDAAVRTWLDHLRVERGLSENTLGAYGRDVRRYLAFLRARGTGDLADVTERDVGDFAMSLRSDTAGGPALSAASAGRSLVAVRGLHRFLAIERVQATDPAAAVRPARAAQRLPKAIPVSDVERLLLAASTGEPAASLRDRAMLELLYGAGARVSEVVGLDVDDLDLGEQGAVRLLGKGNKERVVPLGSYARDAVTAYLVRSRPVLAARGRGTAALLLNQRGARLSRQSVWTVVQQSAGRAGLAGHVSPHTLRHCFATHLLDGGADVRVVQELLGHASVTTTQIYTMVTVQRLREVYAQSHPRAR